MNHSSSVKILGLSLCLTLGLAACRSSETETTEPQKAAPEAVVPAPSTPVEQTAEGELRNVNIEAMTLSIRDASGTETTFSFSPATSITGVPSIQGLAGKQGSQAKVMYTSQGDINSATSIEILEAAPAPSGQKK